MRAYNKSNVITSYTYNGIGLLIIVMAHNLLLQSKLRS